MDDDPWEGIEPERASLAKAIFGAARQIADEDGDGDFDLSGMPPGLQAVGGGFNRLIHKAAEGSLDENNPEDMVDALRVASATLVDQRQPPQYQGFKWLTGGQPLVDPQRLNFSGASEADQPFGPQESQRIVGRTPEGEPIYEPQTGGWGAEVTPELPYETETSMRPKPPIDLREFPQGFSKRSLRRKGGGVY